MALMTARRLVVRGRPPGRAAGSSGATSAQASSVKSVSYNWSVFSTNQLYTDSGKLFKHPLTVRPSLVNTARGLAKSMGERLPSVMRTRWESYRLGRCRRSSDRCWNHCRKKWNR